MQKGFTLIELIIVISLMGLVLSFSFLPNRNTTIQTELDSTITMLISDLRAQQKFAMLGFNQSSGLADTYSIYVQANGYVTFKGNQYSTVNGSNNEVRYPTNTTMTASTILQQTISFERVTGNMRNWSASNNSITLTSGTTQKQLTISQIGTVSIQ